MSADFKVGDRVWVVDDGLAELRKIMERSGHPAPPNHHGTISEFMDGGDVLIDFDDGVGAPYALADVRHLDVASFDNGRHHHHH